MDNTEFKKLVEFVNKIANKVDSLDKEMSKLKKDLTSLKKEVESLSKLDKKNKVEAKDLNSKIAVAKEKISTLEGTLRALMSRK